jgi:hypothetical protein
MVKWVSFSFVPLTNLNLSTMIIENLKRSLGIIVLTFIVAFSVSAQTLDSDNDGIPDDNECGCPGGTVVNGSFESPKISGTSATGFLESDVAGWETTATDNYLEYWPNGFLSVPAADGKQFVELNASQNAALFQKLCLRPGMVVQWSVQHRGRSGTDVAVVKIGATLAGATTVQTMSDGNTAWGQYSGSYTVPAGQTETFFVFAAVSSSNGDPTYGNFIDDIRITVTSRPPCSTDTDGDGVTDNLDLDSDNDGILDSQECGIKVCATGAIDNGGFELPVISGTSATGFLESQVPGWETTATDNYLEYWPNGFLSVPSAQGNQFVELNASQNAALFQQLCLNPGTVVEWKVKHRGRSGTDVAVVKIGATLATAIAQDTMSDGNTSWGSYSGNYTVPEGQEETVFVFEALSSSNGDPSYGNFIDQVEVTIISAPILTCLDTDNDGLPNVQDVDSDGDGCGDAAEAYKSKNAIGTDGNNYYGDGAPPATDSNGKVTAAAYNGVTLPTIIATTATTISQQPADKNMYSATPVTFNVQTSEGSDTTLYQWQVSTDEGMSWSDLSDTTFYSGIKTKNLTVRKSIPAMNGNNYRLKITQTARVCTELYSNSVNLNTCTLTATAGKISDQTCLPLPGEPSNGKAYVKAQNGVPPYSYNWNTTPARTTDTIDQLEPGFYLVTVTDAVGCTWTNAGVAYDQDFDSYTPGRVSDNPPGSALPRLETDADNWFSQVDGNSAFFIPPQFVNLPSGETALWFSDNPGTGIDKLFISDAISVRPNIAHLFTAKVRKSGNNPPIFTAFYSTDNGITWNTIGSVNPSANDTWETAKYIFTPTVNSIKIRIGSTTTGSSGNDGGLDFVRLRELEEGIAVDTGTVPCCKNPTMAGSISLDQFICLNMQPAKLNSTAGASGETGVLQYKWQMSVKEDNSDWTDIPNATGLNYQPPVLNNTTWYRRLSKVDCEETWEDAPSSNVVKITVVPDSDRYLIIESLVQPTCNPPDGCTLTIKGLPTATWTLEQMGPIDATLTGTGNPLVLENLPDGVYQFRTADANGCIESPPFGVIVVTY